MLMLPAWIHGESCEVLSRSTLARSASNKCSLPLKKASSLVMAPGVPGFHCESGQQGQAVRWVIHKGEG